LGFLSIRIAFFLLFLFLACNVIVEKTLLAADRPFGLFCYFTTILEKK